MRVKIITKSSQETYNVGKLLALQLRGGEIISLLGDLGGGKTTFTQGLAAGLGIKEAITSPTFVILKKYQSSHPSVENFYHLDLYRLNSLPELLDLGFADLISDETSVVAIEWANKAREIIPPENNVQVQFIYLGKNTRQIIFSTFK